MDRGEYTARVLSQLRHVTARERTAIQTEIDGHMEDHVCALLDLGYPEELAEERTLSAMGDPAEVGRELDRQYPLRWLAARYLAKILLLWLAVLVLFSLEDGEDAVLSVLRERWAPQIGHHYQPGTPGPEQEQPLDIEFSVGDDVVRVLQVTVYRDAKQDLYAYVNLDSYDKLPLGTVQRKTLLLENQRREQKSELFSGPNRWWHSGSVEVEIQPEDTYVTLTCGGYGQYRSIRVPLPEVVI